MTNMSYCRFENTYEYLEACWEKLMTNFLKARNYIEKNN